MLLALICLPILTVLAAACLVALAPGDDPGRWLVPAARTAAALSIGLVAAVYFFTL